MTLRNSYVRAVQGIRQGAAALGVLGAWDRAASRSNFGRWSRSLLAVYDLQDFVALDLPWWTFDSIHVADDFLASRPHARVFEWGSGASTVWLAKRAASVVAIEHDATWAADVREVAPLNAEVKLVPAGRVEKGRTPVVSGKSGFEGLDFTDYVRAIDKEGGLFDLIVIDGRAREACFPAALRHLSPDGMIVFDNVDRSRYRDAIMAEELPLQVLWTRGLTPCLPYPTRTALIMISQT